MGKRNASQPANHPPTAPRLHPPRLPAFAGRNPMPQSNNAAQGGREGNGFPRSQARRRRRQGHRARGRRRNHARRHRSSSRGGRARTNARTGKRQETRRRGGRGRHGRAALLLCPNSRSSESREKRRGGQRRKGARRGRGRRYINQASGEARGIRRKWQGGGRVCLGRCGLLPVTGRDLPLTAALVPASMWQVSTALLTP